MRSLRDQNLWVLLLAEVEEGGVEKKKQSQYIKCSFIMKKQIQLFWQ